jgi:hypothetical protein
MVPMDVPLPALDMIQTFMYHKSFQTFEQTIKPKAAPEHSCPVCSSAADETDECPFCSACGKEDDGDATPYLIVDTTQIEGPSWMFALLVIFVGLACSCLVTRIQRRPLRFTPVDHMDSEGMEMRSMESIS